MTTSFDSVAKLSERELLDHFARLVARDRRTTAELLVAIAEIDDRKLWAAHACSSMFTFCMERFHMSEQVTAKRLWAARTARRFPVVLEMVARGDLHLGAIHLLARHLTADNHGRVLERARHKSCREVERLVAELSPRADVPSRIRALPGPRGVCGAVDRPGLAAAGMLDQGVGDEASGGAAPVDAASGDETSCSQSTVDAALGGEASIDGALVDGASSVEASTNNDPTGGATGWRDPADGDPTTCIVSSRVSATVGPRTAAKPIVALSPRRYKIEITVDEATHDKLRSLQDLLARSATGRDPAAIISRAIDVLLDRTLARKAGCTDRPKSTTAARPTASAGTTASVRPMRSPRPTASSDPASTGSEKPTTSAETARTGSAKPTTSAEPARTGSAKPTKSAEPARTDSRGPMTTTSDIAHARRRQRNRSIPAAVRREVWRRDSGRCCYVDLRGHRCRETSNIEFHHKTAFALGGLSTTENVELRCAAHNQFQADLDFGRSFMDAKRNGFAARQHSPGNVADRSPVWTRDDAHRRPTSIPRGMLRRSLSRTRDDAASLRERSTRDDAVELLSGRDYATSPLHEHSTGNAA